MVVPSDLFITDEIWSILQESNEAGRLLRLQAALNAGWEIQPPVYARPRWRTGNQPGWMYYFVLTRRGKMRTLGVPESPELSTLMRECRISGGDILFQQHR